MKLIQELLIVAIFIANPTESRKYSLVCPLDFELKGHVLAGGIPNNSQATNEGLGENPVFVCVICSYVVSEIHEVQMCLSKGVKVKTNLSYEYPIGKVPKTVGFTVDMSGEDILTLLQSREAITNSSLQSIFLNCPTGLQLEGFEVRSSWNNQQKDTTCIICSGDGILFSSCCTKKTVLKDQPIYYHPLTDYQRLRKFQPSSNGDRLQVKDLVDGDQSACGTYLSAPNLRYRIADIKAEYLRFDCETRSDGSGIKGLSI